MNRPVPEKRERMKNLHYDSLIIGFGKGGKTLAGRLAKEGEKVALAEKDSTMYGGTCINVGCIPSKSLINSASKVKCMAGREKQSVLYSKAVKEKRRVVEMLRKKNFDKLNQLENVDIYNGTAVFSGVRQADIQTEDEIYRITADKIFINTGSTPRIPNIEGIENTKGIYTSAEIMDLDVFPERLVIIGGGYIGLEFASMFASFGSKVTVLQDGEKFLPKEDDDVAQEIKSILEAQGIEFCTGLKIERVYEENNRPSVSFKLGGEDKVINADAVLFI